MSKPMIPVIAGDELRLRLLQEADLPRTLAWRNQDETRRWFLHSERITPEQHQAWFARYRERADDFLFIIEEPQQRAIGQIGLYNIDWSQRSAEFGRFLLGEANARGRGLARKAAALLLDYGFHVWKLQVISLEVFADNLAAIAVYRRCGFLPTEEKNGLLFMRVLPGNFTQARGEGVVAA